MAYLTIFHVGPMLKLSSAGLAELKHYEGCRLDAYQCEAGKWTIGYGDTSDVQPGMRISLEESDQRLAKRVTEFEQAVHKAVRRPMTQGQFDAFVSLAFNIGSAGFAGSTLVKMFNSGDEAETARQFGRWIHVKKVVSPNLVKRRFSEVVRYFQRPPLP